MSVVFKTKLLIQNAGRLLVLACTDEKGGIQYDFLGGDIKDIDNIQTEISKLIYKEVHARVKRSEFFSKSSSINSEGNTLITIYYLCEIGVDVLKLSQDYDSYYWLEIDDIIAQPVLPAWIKGAALLLSSKLKQKQQIEKKNEKSIAKILTSLGAKETKRANGSIHFSKHNKTFCIIDKAWIQILFDDSYNLDFDYKIATRKGIQWLQVEKSTQNIDLKQLVISAFELV